MTSFAADILPLFTQGQVRCMRNHGVRLDDYAYMSDPQADVAFADHAKARHVYARLAGDELARMPPSGPY